MNPQALESLNPIHLPDPVSLWPLAPGWWILICLPFVIGGLLVAWSFYKKQPKQLACKSLTQLQLELDSATTDKTQQQLLQEINQLLKRVSLILNPLGNTAKLSGATWGDYLVKQSEKEFFTSIQKQLLMTGPYAKPDSQQLDQQILGDLISRSKQWIKQHP